MQTQEVRGPACPHGGQATEAQDPTVAHRQGVVDVDRAPCTADQCEEEESRQEPQDEARAASRIRASFKTLTVPSRSAERVLPSKTTGPRLLPPPRPRRYPSRPIATAPSLCELLFFGFRRHLTDSPSPRPVWVPSGELPNFSSVTLPRAIRTPTGLGNNRPSPHATPCHERHSPWPAGSFASRLFVLFLFSPAPSFFGGSGPS